MQHCKLTLLQLKHKIQLYFVLSGPITKVKLCLAIYSKTRGHLTYRSPWGCGEKEKGLMVLGASSRPREPGRRRPSGASPSWRLGRPAVSRGEAACWRPWVNGSSLRLPAFSLSSWICAARSNMSVCLFSRHRDTGLLLLSLF